MKMNYSQDKVREMLEDFHEKHFEPSWKRVAEEIGIRYTYFMDFRAGTRNVGPETLEKIVDFIIKN